MKPAKAFVDDVYTVNVSAGGGCLRFVAVSNEGKA